MIQRHPCEPLPLQFPVRKFTDQAVEALLGNLDPKGPAGMVLGASGGIDSLATAALCVRAEKRRRGLRVVGLQMNDRRVRGETYNSGLYEYLGVRLVSMDLTSRARAREQELGLPPRWVAAGLMKAILRYTPKLLKRRIILAMAGHRAPEWALRYYTCLTVPHTLRMEQLKAYAKAHDLLPVLCTNRTERRLGFFVEGGIDDTRTGDAAPLSSLYKTQVNQEARFLELPSSVIKQPPSPGFGGVRDVDILGPYPVIDLVLQSLERGDADRDALAHVLSGLRTCARGKHSLPRVRLRDIRFVRGLLRRAQRKTPRSASEARPFS